MAISAKLIRMQLGLFKHTLKSCELASARTAQDKIGLLMARTHGSKVSCSTQVFRDFIAEWIVPKANTQPGVILYLHGGGYVSGNIDYAKGFGTILAARNGIRVFCAAYRLAPEHRFPAALSDALEAYRYLLAYGYQAKDIVLCGESAGGGLIYALIHMLKQLSIPLPGGLIAISPWTDLTLSGESYETVGDSDPSFSKDCLAFYARLYTDDPENPFASPLFGDLTGFPPSLIFAGECEILLDDSVRMHKKLRECGCKSSLYIARDMWHAYVLYGVKPSPQNHLQIGSFIKDVTR
jgi:acetyl esterase/lipase